MAINTANLWGAWECEELSGTRQDAHTTNQDLTDNNGVGQVAGLIGNAADCDFANGEYLSAAVQLGLGADESFTIAFLCYFPVGSLGDASDHWVGDTDGRLGNATWSYRIRVGGASQNMIFLVSNGTTFGGVASANNSITTGQWYRVIAWHDAAGDLVGLSIDDVEVTAAWAGGTWTNSGGGTPHFGFNDGSTSSWFDQIFMWKGYALTSTERDELYNAGSWKTYAGLAGGAATPLDLGQVDVAGADLIEATAIGRKLIQAVDLAGTALIEVAPRRLEQLSAELQGNQLIEVAPSRRVQLAAELVSAALIEAGLINIGRLSLGNVEVLGNALIEVLSFARPLPLMTDVLSQPLLEASLARKVALLLDLQGQGLIEPGIVHRHHLGVVTLTSDPAIDANLQNIGKLSLGTTEWLSAPLIEANLLHRLSSQATMLGDPSVIITQIGRRVAFAVDLQGEPEIEGRLYSALQGLLTTLTLGIYKVGPGLLLEPVGEVGTLITHVGDLILETEAHP